MMRFSVLLSVYHKENPEWLKEALESIYNQTLLPSQVVLVEDGPLTPDLNAVIQTFPNLTLVKLEKNQGLGPALNEGLKHCNNELVIRMDTDDICSPIRFEKQIVFMEQHPKVDVLGGQMTEFIEEPTNIVGKRIVPYTHKEILYMLKQRCPLNHVCVCLRRSAVQKVGGYKAWFWNEDYYLWIRMALAGCIFANLPDTLVNVRVGKEMYARRGGWKYFKSEAGLQKYMWKNGLISFPLYCYNILGRFIIQIAMPNSLRGFVFRTIFRQS